MSILSKQKQTLSVIVVVDRRTWCKELLKECLLLTLSALYIDAIATYSINKEDTFLNEHNTILEEKTIKHEVLSE